MISTPMKVDPGPGTSRILLCSSCHQGIGTDKRIFECKSCGAAIHLACAPRGYTEQDIEKLKRPDSILAFYCTKCSYKKKRKAEEPIDLDKSFSLADSSANEGDEQITLLKERINEMDAIISELRRQIASLQGDETNETGKRRRSVANVTFHPDISGIPEVVVTESLPDTHIAAIQEIINKAVVSPLNGLNRVLAGVVNRVERIELAFSRTPSLASSDNVKPTSRGRSKSPAVSSNGPKKGNSPISKTFAEIVAGSTYGPGSIRHIHINCAEENCQDALMLIQKDQLCASQRVVKIQPKGPSDFSVTCANDESAAKVEAALLAKYRDALTIATPKPVVPQVKITRLITDIDDPNEILLQLVAQNSWLSSLNITADRHYKIHTESGSYVNIVITTDLVGQRKLLDIGSVIFGLKQSKIYEYCDINQCKRCQGLGHLARNCKKDVRCRICAGKHETKSCTPDAAVQCANCLDFNIKSKEKLDVAHRSSDDRCTRRILKIKQIKQTFLTKNEKTATQLELTSEPKN